jgi:hypothetical protein
MVKGSVADELAVENAVSNTGIIAFKCVKGFIRVNSFIRMLKTIRRWISSPRNTVKKNADRV